MMRKFAGFAFGFVIGGVAVAVIQGVSNKLYPLPKGLDPQAPDYLEALAEHVAGLPLAAFFLVLVSHGAGAFVAGAVSSLIVGMRWWAGAAGLGVLFLLAGVMNLVFLPHPVWFAVVDLAVYLPAALAGCWLAGVFRGGGPGRDSGAGSTPVGQRAA